MQWLANKCQNISFFAHTPLGGRLGSYETQRSSDGFQDRLAQWLSSSSTQLHWNTSVSTSAYFTHFRTQQYSSQVMVGYAAVVSCQSSQVRCVFQRCIWPTVWSWGAQDEGETGCFSTISITWWTISLWDWLKTAMGWAFSFMVLLLCKCSQESVCSKCLCPYFSEFRLWWKSREYSHHLCSTSH